MTHRVTPPGPAASELAPPEPGGAIHRARLSGRLDDAWERRLGWISGPAGAGKSTLVAEWVGRTAIPTLWYRVDGGDSDPATFFHYLGAALPAASLPVLGTEHLLDLPTFARRWFERFRGQLDGPTLLVLDDYQHVDDDSPLHAMLAAALGGATSPLGVFFVSRRPPPSAFVRLRAHGALHPIDHEELRLRDDEALELARTTVGEGVDSGWVTRINDLVEGWCAGLRLLLEVGQERGTGAEIPDASRRVFFDYFAVEVFDRAPAALRRFMMETSVVLELSAPLAERLTGRADAGEALDGLVQQGLFTTRLGDGQSFRYHALFRDFLRRRLERELDDDARAACFTRAASLLAEGGDVDAAVELLFDAKEWSRAAALVLEHAPGLLATGRYRTLARWLGGLPRGVAAKNAWIGYWRGMAMIALSPVDAVAELEHALDLHRAAGDRGGELLTLAGICETIALSRHSFIPLDRWLAEVDERLNDGGFPSEELALRCVPSFFAAASHRRPDHPRMEEWERQLQVMVSVIPNRDQRAMTAALLLNHLAWTGRTAAAAAVLESLREGLEPIEECAPLTQILFHLLASIVTWQHGAPEEAVRLIDRALEVGRHEGIRVWDSTVAEGGCYALLGADDPDGAERYLLRYPDPLPGRTANRAARLQLHALVHLRRGELAAAAAHLEMAEQLANEAGAVIFDALLGVAAGHLALARGDRQELQTRTTALRALATKNAYHQFEAEAALLEAAAADSERTRSERLVEAFRISRALGGTFYPWWSKSQRAAFCAHALKHDIEADYVRRLVVRLGLVEHPPPDADATWPWRLRVRTLGAFEIHVDGAPIDLGRKTPRRALELLAALVATGGEASSGELALTLFPENEGDAAAAALKTTIARLRKLVGRDAIAVRAGVVSLSSTLVWADALALRRALDAGGDAADAAVERWYAGSFLPHHDATWILTARAELHRRVLDLFLREARRELESERADDAAARIERCLAIDPSNEPAHRLLMLCHASRGDVDALSRTFSRCREWRLEGGGPGLDPETVELYERLRRET